MTTFAPCPADRGGVGCAIQSKTNWQPPSGGFFHFGESMKSDLATSAAKVAPAVGSNFWLWLTSHDINWWVAVATIAYIGLQAYYLVKNKGKRALLDG
ncbi:hypothetical protein [Burkholderia anthinoferrum]